MESEGEMMKETKLKLCPFCGGKVIIGKNNHDIYVVECTNCYISVCALSGSKKWLIEAWNRRAG